MRRRPKAVGGVRYAPVRRDGAASPAADRLAGSAASQLAARFGVSSAVAPVAAGLVVAGFVAMLANVIVASLHQRLVPGHLLGRVGATMRLIAVGAAPLGALLAGTLGDLVGLRAVFVAAAVLSLAALPGFRVLTESALSRAEASATSASATAEPRP